MNSRKLAFVGLPILLLGVIAYLVISDVWTTDFTGESLNGDTTAPDIVVAPKIDGVSSDLLDAGAGVGSGIRESLVDWRAEFEAALSGFRGRVIDSKRQPLPDRIVRFYRLDAEVLQSPGLFAAQAEGSDADLKVQIHEGRTDAEGRFVVTGAWPNSFYILEADAEGEDRLTMPVDRTPETGEIVDLGDIQLVQLGTIVGRVVDEEGNGVPGAMIRAADVPGMFLDFAPVERFEPEGAIIVREGNVSIVIEMPPFVKRYFDILMKPRTVTKQDGTFRLTAVQPRENVVVVNKKAFVAQVKKGVKVTAGKEKDIGTIRLRAGEEAFVKVLDTADEPVAGAELLIGATTVLIPVDFAIRVGQTDLRGEFSITGWPPGKITVAARRSRADPWVVNEPENVAADIVVRLPGRHHLDLKITSSVGQDIVNAEFKLMPSPDGGIPLDIGAMGFIKWLDIDDNVERLKDGRYRINELIPGKYTLAVAASGHAAARVDFKIEKNATASITLRPEAAFVVNVVDSVGKPVRHAKIYVLTRSVDSGRKLLEMPIVVGETDKRGQLRVKDGEIGKVRLSASHPAYGYAHAEVKLPTPDPIVLRMAAPGKLLGVLREHGRPPTPGKWTIIAELRNRRDKGAMPEMPKFTVPDLEGNFGFAGLRPGDYRLRVMKSLSALTSPGGMIGFMMRMRMLGDIVTKDVVIVAGRETYVELEAIKEAESVDGPSARVSGTVLLNGRPGAGLTITGRGGRRYGVTVGDGGRFDLGQVPVGTFEIAVRDTSKADVIDMRMESHLWSRKLKIEPEMDVVLDIQIRTGRVSGVVRTVEGAVAAGVRVRAKGMQVGSESKHAVSSSAVTMTDERGRFSFDALLAGTYQIEARDRQRGFGKAEPFELYGSGAHLDADIVLLAVHSVSGRVDLEMFGDERPQWCYLQFRLRGNPTENHGSSVRRDGKFRLRGIPSGEYTVKLFIPGDSGRSRELTVTPTVVVRDKDATGLVLTPHPEPEPPESKKGGEDSKKRN